ncbi:PAP2 superfamily-domain-containing protein [Lipomyces arxii]|uniref:PAP2 superfamily-domain-containing protein n=1 Tax=Lipomyces arxii TaxID=56418 RepID=UPI0034CECB95
MDSVNTMADCVCPGRPPASLRFTHVYYDSEDWFAFAMAWISLVPQIICVIYVTLIFSRREIETVLMLIGQLASEAFNHLLKKYFREERPRYNEQDNRDNLGYGLPSAHSQFMAFHATYLCLWMFLRAHQFSQRKRYLRAISLACLTSTVIFSRVYLYYHTWKQVIVGFSIGVVTGTLWFAGIVALRELGVIELILNLSVVRAMYFKDTTYLRSFVRDEFVAWTRNRVTYDTYYSNRVFYVKERKLR